MILGGSETHIGEENAWDPTAGMLTLFMAVAGIIAAIQASLMASDRILMRLHTSIAGMAIGSKSNAFIASFLLVQ